MPIFPNPEEATPNLSILTGVPDDLYMSIQKKVYDSRWHTSAWAYKQDKWHRLRMRIKKEKTSPFIGCSNIRMPTAEKYIKKLKAAIMNVWFGIRPVVQVIPSPSQTWDFATKIEKFLDHIIMDVMLSTQTKLQVAVDQELEKGFMVVKPYWRYETTFRTETFSLDDMSVDETLDFFNPMLTEDEIAQKLFERIDADDTEDVEQANLKVVKEAAKKIHSGATSVTIKIEDVTVNAPDIALVPPDRCYVPSDATAEVPDIEWICHEMYISDRQLKQNAENGKGWDKAKVDSIHGMKWLDIDARNLPDITKDLREGIERLQNPSSKVRVWEWYGWHDLDGDGIPEKVCITLAPDFHLVLRKISLPYENGQFPFIKLYYELIDDRWFSHRSLIEILEDIIKEIDVQHMQKIDQQTIRNAPMFVYKAGMVNPNLVQFIPNQGIPVHGMGSLDDTLKTLQNSNPNIELSYDREQQILETQAQELIGPVDYTLQSMINRRQPRTLGEVQLQSQNQQLVFSLDASNHVRAFTQLINWVWDLWSQYGPEEYEFAYFGPTGYESIKITKDDMLQKPRLVARGNDTNTNPQVRLQKLGFALQMQQSPMAIQMGVVTPQTLAELYKRAYQELGLENWEKLVPSQPVAPQQPNQPIQPQFDDLAPGEQMQVLSRHGVQPDVRGRMLEKAHQILDEHADNLQEETNGATVER